MARKTRKKARCATVTVRCPSGGKIKVKKGCGKRACKHGRTKAGTCRKRARRR